MLSSSEIRQQFIDYFVQRHEHTFVPSAPLPVRDDPTLMFMNSGMVQFKDVFLGTGTRPYQRAANSQKCLRVSGKHNDLSDVGRDTYHHTFFEMLGFWSFGDYFKREAIAWLWELLTDVWGLPKDRLYATVFEGDPSDGIDRDEEAAGLWAEVTDIDPSRIQYWGKKDNFWEMGEIGPCGPCSEVHIDLTPDGSGAELVNADDPRVIELGNIVFIQYNRDSKGKLTPLPAKHVDFGGGFERLTAVLQGKASNYDTDLFAPIFEATREIAGVAPYGGTLEDRVDVAYRVVADHLRCLTFAITDGVIPSNEAEGYVLRRILRRAVRHGRQTMGITDPFLHRLVPVVVEIMGDAFPELPANAERTAEIIRDEEESFARTLDRGIELFEAAAKRVEDEGDNQIPALDAFRLHDTYGFPLDLTQVMAEERGMNVDVEGFEHLMDEARELSRAAAGKGGALGTLVEVVQRAGPADTDFCGYDHTVAEAESVVLLCRLADDRYEESASAAEGEEVAVAFPRTPFYAEAGGQVGDTGTIEWDGGRVRVTDTQKVGGVHFHLGVVEAGELRAGEGRFRLTVDEPRRQAILGHHTGTHMMNLAFRRILGTHVEQKGSLVDDEKLRFDLSHPQPVTGEEIVRIEDHVNADIGRDLPVYDEVVPLTDAYRIRNLRAVFGEKYPPRIRVVAIGVPVSRLLEEPDNPDWDGFSIELCGGTHLGKTGEAGVFTITHEEAVAKGIRRVTALTGAAAEDALARGQELRARVEALAQAPDDAVAAELPEITKALNEAPVPHVLRTGLREALTDLQKRVKEHAKQQEAAAAGTVVERILELVEAADGEVVVGSVPDTDPGILRGAVEAVRGRRGDVALLVASSAGDKAGLVAAVPKPLVERGLKAGDWVREAAAAAGGKGGGRPDIAQAGAKDPAKLPDALEAARRYAAETLGN